MRWIATDTTDYDSFGGSYGYVLSHVGTTALESWVWVAPDVATTDDKLATPEECTVERIVGTLSPLVINVDAAGASQNYFGYFHERIHLGILDMGSGTPVVPPSLLQSADEAEESFLWERKRTVSSISGGTLAEIRNGSNWVSREAYYMSDPYWNTVDIRVNRRLTTGTALIYSTQLEILAGAWNAVGARVDSLRGVRVLVKNVR